MRGLGRDFNFLLAARGISVIGDQAALIALIFKVKSHGSWATAALLAGTSIAVMLTSTWIGKMVDKNSVKKILIITSALQALVCFALLYSNLYTAIALNILLGIGQATVMSATGAWTPTLVSSENLSKAFGQMQIVFNIAALAGYGIGGLLVGKAGINQALALDAISFLLLIPMLLAMKTDRVGNPVLNEHGKMHGGFKIVRESAALRNIAIMLTAFITLLGMFMPLEVFLTTNILGAGAFGYGVINMIWAGSLAVGAILITKVLKPNWGYAKPALLSSFLAGISLIFIGFAPNLVFLGAVMAVTGIIVSAFNIFFGPLIVNNAVESELGRVNSTIGALNSAGTVVGMAVGGILGNIFSVRIVIAAAGALAAISLLFTGRGLMAAEKKKGSE